MFMEVYMPGINDVNNEYVQELVDSILTNGWVGAPILHHDSIGLITGSHRVAALNIIREMYEEDELTDDQYDVVEKINREKNYELNVTDIVDEFLEENPEEGFEFDSLGHVFEGTEVEEWKDEILEW